EVSGEDMLFYVKDTGIGISKDFLNMIFERFYKGADDETKIYRGTGLGLAISRRLAELLGGKLWADSAVSIGTTFYFSHPISKDKEIKKEGSKSGSSVAIKETYNFSGSKILVVEDEENNFLFLRGVLKKTQATLDWAAAHAKPSRHVRRIGELGIGLNPHAKVVGCTILDEKALGTAHLAIGSNAWFGGAIKTIIHLDQVIKNPAIMLDGRTLALPVYPLKENL
ncbi:MAG: hypothetical protein HC945_01030, partial [Nitrosarchaeum sp.]|nr:hypothetical protein [Nitrosarchaeum sp.]